MKALPLLALLILINITLFAQSSKKLSLKAWVKQNGYILLSDKSKLPKSILPYYAAIKDSIIKRHSRFNDFPDFASAYVPKHGVDENDTIFSATIYPIDGLKLIKKYEDKKTPPKYDKKLKEYVQIIDDFGGSVGEVILRLNKTTQQITFLHTQ